MNKKDIEYNKKHAKKAEENGQFDTVWHDNLKKLKPAKKIKILQKEPEFGEDK